MAKKYFIFDFDGVVVDTESVFAHFDCTLLNAVLEQAGFEPSLTPADIRKLAGNNDESKLNIVATRFEFNPAPYRDTFINKRSAARKTLFQEHKPALGKNLKSFLDALETPYALATNKLKHKLSVDMQAMGIDDLFEHIVTADPPLAKKPAPDIILRAMELTGAKADETAYIGDNTLDMQAAIHAGVTPIGFVIEGLEQKPERSQTLQDAGAEIILDDFHDLLPYVSKS